MAKITRIKASDGPSRREEEPSEPTITRKKVTLKDKKSEKEKRKEIKAAEKKVSTEVGTKKKAESGEKKPFILIRPFVYLWRYLKGSWAELRQVRWPNRKATWKMVIAVLVYTVLFVALIMLLDMFFGWLFNVILGNK